MRLNMIRVVRLLDVIVGVCALLGAVIAAVEYARSRRRS